MREGVIVRPMVPEDVGDTHRAASIAAYESSEEKERLKHRSPEEIEPSRAGPGLARPITPDEDG